MFKRKLRNVAEVDTYFQNKLIAEKDWSFFPFNGQILRSRKILEIIDKLDPKLIVETGTYYGESTQFLASFSNCLVITIEKNELFANEALKKFLNNGFGEKIELVVGDSKFKLKEVLDEGNRRSNTLVAYFDAHWNEELPLRYEISEILDWNAPAVIVIDDFEVPDYPDFGFDLYDGVPIGINLFSNLASFSLWVPNYSPKHETGARRGTAYLLNKKARKILGRKFFCDLKKLEIAPER